jgi:hypothetical protein
MFHALVSTAMLFNYASGQIRMGTRGYDQYILTEKSHEQKKWQAPKAPAIPVM